MAFTELELQRCEKALAAFLKRRRPPADRREQVDLSYRIEGHSVEIFELRQDWLKPNAKYKFSVAKTTFVRTKSVWKLFWKRRDRKWHSYDPHEFKTLGACLKMVDMDEYGCFFG